MRMVEDAVGFEPVSTPDSRLSGKITGNFVNRMGHRLLAGVKRADTPRGLTEIPCEIEQGISGRETGIFSSRNRDI